MGFSHYWCRRVELPVDAFASATADFLKVSESLRVPLAGFDGTGAPICTPEAIVFNGVGGAGREPFEIHQTEFDRSGNDLIRASCKTGNAPYDLDVQCVLIILKHRLGHAIQVTSDGKSEEWDSARAACQAALGYGMTFQLDE